MAVQVKDTRKVVVIEWDETVVGKTASLQVHGQEKRTVDNDRESNLFFPADFTGDVHVVVKGSKSGEDHGTISVA